MKDKDLAMYLNELRKEALAHAIAAGFHDTYHSIEHYLCLVVSELMEAVEADRKDRHCTLDFDIDILFDIENKVAFQITFEDKVKDTVEDELADTVIRLLDFAGLTGLSIIRLVPIDIQKQEFTDWAFIAVRAVQRIADILGFSPLRALVIELLHNLQRKLFALGVRMRYAQHSHAHLIQAGITEADG